MADSEFDEAGRAELIREIADIIYWDEGIRQPLALWAFLWLADLPCLERIKERLTEGDPLGEFARLTRDVVLPWLCKDKGEAKSADNDLRELTLNRDLHCVISQIANRAVLDCTHIYPNSLGSTGYKPGFWDRLRLFWSEEKVNEWASLLGTLQGTERLLNTITLNVLAHKAWGQALFAFKHLETSAGGKRMDLQFYWLKPHQKTPTRLNKEDFIKRPLLPSNEACGEDLLFFHNVCTSQQIKSGDIITMRTSYPDEESLPSKALIDLQWYLNRIASLSAAATDAELKKFSDDDDDGFDSRAILATSETASTNIFSSQAIMYPSSISGDLTSDNEDDDDDSEDDDDDQCDAQAEVMDVTDTESTY